MAAGWTARSHQTMTRKPRMQAPCSLPWGWLTSLGPGSQTSCCKQLLHPVPHLCCNPGSIIPVAQAPTDPTQPSAPRSPSLSPNPPEHTCRAVAVPHRRCVLCHVLRTRSHSHIPSPDPCELLSGLSAVTEGDKWPSLGPHQRQPKGQQNPTGVLGPASPASRQSQTSTAKFCSTGPKESQECITDTVRHSHQRQELCSAPGHPGSTAATRGHQLARTGWDSTFRCVRAIQRALFSFKNYL